MLRLSEAIRLGSLLHPQCFGSMYEFQDHGEDETIRASCALGAAEHAGFVWMVDLGFWRCPACPNFYGLVPNLVPHLNDTHRWTREAIADWVESIEIVSGVRAEAEAQEVPC